MVGRGGGCGVAKWECVQVFCKWWNVCRGFSFACDILGRCWGFACVFVGLRGLPLREFGSRLLWFPPFREVLGSCIGFCTSLRFLWSVWSTLEWHLESFEALFLKYS